MFYTAVAANFGDARMCEKISSRAIDQAGPTMEDDHIRVSFQRSECYFFTVFTTDDGHLCDSVKGLTTIPSNESEFSERGCREALMKGGYFSIQPIVDSYEIASLMKEMGYSDKDFYETDDAANPSNNPVCGFYLTVRDTDSFKGKIRALPSYDEPYSADRARPLNDDELLIQMVASDDALPEYCSKLSPNSYAEGQSKLVPGLRSGCFFYLAKNMRQSALCAKIGEYASSSYVSRQRCEEQLQDSLRRGERAPPRTRERFGPTVFPTAARLARAMRKLGYSEPFVTRPGGADWNGFYGYLRFHASAEQKQEFLHRAETLPSFSN